MLAPVRMVHVCVDVAFGGRLLGCGLRKGGKMTSLAEEYPKQQARLRELLEQYETIGQAGLFARAMIKVALNRADRAAAEQDTVAMIKCFQEMKEFK